MLVLTRRTGEATYIGRDLTDDIEQTYDYVIRIAAINDGEKSVEVTVDQPNEEGWSYELDKANDEIWISKEIRLVLLDVRTLPVRDGVDASTMRLGIDAPRSYRILRDNAIRRTA